MFDEKVLLGEQDFEKQMKDVVEPFLEKHLEKGFIESFDGTKIHYLFYRTKEANGNVVISHGFCEYAPKYEEMVYYLLLAGYNVCVPEHRGHGFSDRKVANDEMVHIDSYEEYVQDLHEVVTKLVSPRNRYLLAHSMGGAIAVRYLEEYPEDFERVILTSPMCGMRTGKFPKWIARDISRMMKKLGKGEDFAMGQHGFRDTPTFETSSAMSRARYMFFYNMRLQNMNYRTYGGSFSWVYASLTITKRMMKKKELSKISCPILLFQAGKDHMVDNEAQNRFLELVPQCRMIRISESKHEIFNGNETCRQRFYREVFSFLE